MDKNPDTDQAVIIIVNWNGLHFLEDCLTSAEQQTYESYEIILVDNGSADGSIEYVKRHFPKVKILELERNVGFAKANNIAIGKALHQKINYIALLNNDTKADRRWLEKLIEASQTDVRVGICASKILLLSDPTIIDSTGHIFQSGKIGDRGYGEIDSGQYDDQLDVIGACAGACLYKREMLEDIGLFDESFITYYEDADLSWRSHNKGWKAKYVPESVVLHHHSGTISNNEKLDQLRMELLRINLVKMIRNNATFSQKLRTSYAWIKMASNGEFRKWVKGHGEGGKPYLDRLKKLWL
jgi:GT2 family glycosyltransferase